MSHFVDIVTSIRNQEALVKALERLGFPKNKLRINDGAMQMLDYWGRPSNNRANVIIPRELVGHADVGFEKTGDTYALRLDSYDREQSHGGKFDDKWLGQVVSFHNLEVAKKALDLKGLKYFEDMTEDNEPRLRVKIL